MYTREDALYSCACNCIKHRLNKTCTTTLHSMPCTTCRFYLGNYGDFSRSDIDLYMIPVEEYVIQENNIYKSMDETVRKFEREQAWSNFRGWIAFGLVILGIFMGIRGLYNMRIEDQQRVREHGFQLIEHRNIK